MLLALVVGTTGQVALALVLRLRDAILALPLLLLCVPIWLTALGLEGLETLRRELAL